ncbi:unnamed protein product [Ectocarpus fasciculatus]
MTQNMSGDDAVWRTFQISGNYTRCTVCKQRFSHKERVQANPPTAEQPGWKNKRCHPNCEQAAKSRVRSKERVPPEPVVMDNQFDTVRCCLCHNRIARGARMKADKHDVDEEAGQQAWFNKQHHPRCPEPAVGSSSRRSGGASAIDSVFSGGGIFDLDWDDLSCDDEFAGELEELAMMEPSCTVCGEAMDMDQYEPDWNSPLGPVCEECEPEVSGVEKEYDGDYGDEQGDEEDDDDDDGDGQDDEPPSANPRKRRRSGDDSRGTEKRSKSKKKRRGGDDDARRDSGSPRGSRSRPAPQRTRAAKKGEKKKAGSKAKDDVECVRAPTSTERIDEQISKRQRELGVVDVEGDNAAASCRNLAATEGWVVGSSRSKSAPAQKECSRKR